MTKDNLPLHRKYRPNKLEDIVGNESLIESLSSVLEKEIPPSTYLFSGPSGCGKTTLARILAKEFGADPQRGIIEIDIGQAGGVADAQKIIENLRFKPFKGKCKVYILDEVHDSNSKFQTRLLKTLEEPNPGVYFILCTTDPQKLLKTVRGRCTKYQVRSLRSKELKTLLKKVLIEEEKLRGFPKEAINEIILASEGSPREALIILDSIIDIKDEEKLLESINDFNINKKELIELSRALLKGEKWKRVSEILRGLDEEPETIRHSVLNYMGSVLLKSANDRAYVIIGEFKEPFYNSKRSGVLEACYTVCNL
ncbi:hypothetical protein LCGC14_1355450 [marine sediment metagenome]|uniref:AAA+ ATPase domain-containing protein n=1 Tax=marine sediment metagenome TaxID=412755 RepID=A0A0F9NBY9_9ZZZZ